MSGTLLTRLDSLGDVLLTGPAVRAAARSGGPVTLVVGPRGVPAARMLPGVDEVVVFPTPWIDATPGPVDRGALDALVSRIAAIAPERAAILGSFHQSPLPTALLLRLAGVPEIAAVSVDYPGTLLDHRLRDPGDVHEVERSLLVVRALGLEPDDDPGMAVLRDPAKRPDALPDGDYLVVHPGASVPARAWAPERNRDLVRALAARGHRVVVTGGPDETALTALVSDGGATALDLGGRTDVPGMAEILAGARVVVVGNTGPAHLAAAVRVPIVSLFAPTVPAVRWRPWAVPQELLHLPVPCAGCRATACPVPGHPCLDDLPVDEVVAATERVLRGAVRGPAPSPDLEVTR
ncbi:glycosyltransferase family 9 protein [Patulibacter sp. S7RM1-6]